MSPYFMLFARHPIIPPAHVQSFEPPIDLNNVQEATKSVLHRAQVAQKAGIIAAENLKIAQHRDTLRYATIRGGGYLPAIRHFEVGDFVYLRRRVLDSTLQIPAKKDIYRVNGVWPNGAIQLQGKCGVTLMNNVCNVAPCHLPDIDPIIDHTLARSDQHLACEVCRFMDEDGKMILCDGCGTGWHTMCLDPPLEAVPRGDWLCPRCIHDGVNVADLKAMRVRQKAEPGPLLRGRPVRIFEMRWLAGASKNCRLFKAAQWHPKSSMGGAALPSLEWCIMREHALVSSASELFSGSHVFLSAAVRHRLMPESPKKRRSKA